MTDNAKRRRPGSKLIRTLLILISLPLLLVSLILLFFHLYEPRPGSGFAFSSRGGVLTLDNGYDLSYLDSGDPDGMPVFYFHGGPGSRLEGLLYENYNSKFGIRMISVDRPGYGRSDYRKDRVYNDFADDIRQLADYLNIEKFLVMGWSSGGPYAAVCARELPDRVEAAIIAAGEGPYAHADFPYDRLGRDDFTNSSSNRLFKWSAEKAPVLMETMFRIFRFFLFSRPDSFMETMGGSSFEGKDAQFFLYDGRELYVENTIEAFRQGSKGVTHDFVLERRPWPFSLEEITDVPVLVVHGDSDTSVSPEVGQFVSDRIPASDELVVFEGEGHSVLFYRYEEIIDKVRYLLYE